MRKPIVAGNWKMNKTLAEAVTLAEGLKRELADNAGVEVVLCPPFTALAAVSEVIGGSSIDLGAQNMHFESSGAYTGEVSPAMLRDLYCHYVILGHSERRAYFGETDELINTKVKAARAAALKPIICVGETLDQRENGVTEKVVEEQVRGCLNKIDATDALESVIAYEPVWAIGTGKTATPEQAQQVHAFIRAIVKDIYDSSIADALRIQYGGSMKPSNATELIGQPDIDGGLIGGAALDVNSFGEIVKAAS